MTALFDASIDLVPGITGGRRIGSQDVEAVRDAVSALSGSGWVSVECAGGVPDRCEWLTVYEPGRAVLASGPGAAEQRRKIEQAVRTTLRGLR
jgi:hypothetical protein